VLSRVVPAGDHGRAILASTQYSKSVRDFSASYHSAERADLHFTFESQEGLCKREERWNVSPRRFMTATLHCFGLTLFYVGIEIRTLVLLQQHPSNITHLGH